ncbi:TetR/AcrR family transcriptional regulator [Brachybacterium huguangmaarense]|uniref:TetR/AcrR family transcriptional regulator n=1 Tax=Brachybacterium huguangmaarense TaxID=1652028 RepID=A0ABY6G181_9MICO|nr:TetR/AcrR family transcriptional regulator [Brachybacterium huguangmaarense]UYG16586.1 TetR/AcrR family transcriptional regulator [Brachybacterium huguangmaarense]
MEKAGAAPFHVGLTPDRVIDAAIELTRESHLFSWSIRDLAGRLGVAPSVIYHHVGGKDLLCRRVAEHVLGIIVLPSSRLDWREWFGELLLAVGPLMEQYPGVAKWMLMHGPTVPAVLPTLEAGLAVLRRAGFEARSELAYAILLNTAMLTVSIGDDRLQHEGDGPRDHATMMEEFSRMPTASADVRSLGSEFIRPLAEGGREALRARHAYYRSAVETVLDGLEVSLKREGRTGP